MRCFGLGPRPRSASARRNSPGAPGEPSPAAWPGSLPCPRPASPLEQKVDRSQSQGVNAKPFVIRVNTVQRAKHRSIKVQRPPWIPDPPSAARPPHTRLTPGHEDEPQRPRRAPNYPVLTTTGARQTLSSATTLSRSASSISPVRTCGPKIYHRSSRNRDRMARISGSTEPSPILSPQRRMSPSFNS